MQRFLLWFLFILSSYTLFAHDQGVTPYNETWKWSTYSERDGLDNSAYLTMYEAKDGTLWAGNDHGISWFDNYNWHQINMFSITYNWNASIKMGETESGDLLVLRPDTLFLVNKQRHRRLLLNLDGEFLRIMDVAFEKDDIYLIYYTKDQDNCTLARVKGKRIEKIMSGLSHQNSNFFGLFTTRFNHVYFQHGRTLFSLHDLKLTKLLQIDKDIAVVTHVDENAEGKSVISYYCSPTVFRLGEFNRKAPINYKQIDPELNTIPISVAIGKNQNIFIVNKTGNLLLSDRHKTTTWGSLPQSSSKNFVFLTKNEDVWVGSFANVFCYQTEKQTWTFTQPGEKNEHTYNTEIFFSADSSLWLGYQDGIRVMKKNGKIENISRIEGHPVEQITAINQDKKGNIWIGSGAQKNMTFCFDGKRWKHIGKQEGFTDQSVHKIIRGPEGELYFLVFVNGGFSVKDGEGYYVLKDDKFIQPLMFSDSKWQNYLPQRRFYSLLVQKDNVIWASSTDHLFKITGTKVKDFRTVDGFPIGTIYDLTFDQGNSILAFSSPNGLCVIRDDTIHRLQMPQNYDSKRNLAEVLKDKNGIVWYSGNEGIYAYHDSAYYYIDQFAGLKSQSTWRLLEANNHLYIGTNGEGLNILNLDVLHIPAPRFVISSPYLDGKNAHFNWDCFTYRKIYPDKYAIAYKVDNGPWSNWIKTESLMIPSLSYGKHTISFKAKGIFPNLNSSMQMKVLTVPYPYYLQPFFYMPILFLVVVLILLALIAIGNNKRYIRLLRKNEYRLLSFIESIPFNSLVITSEGYCVEAHQSFNSQDSIIQLKEGDQLLDFLPKNIHGVFREKFHQAFFNRTPQVVEFSLNNHGKEGFFELQLSPFKITDENSNLCIGILMDVTANTMAEQELKRAKQEAENAGKAKMLFLTNMSHEIRTPMNAVLGITNLMLDDSLEDSTRENLHIIKRSSENLLVIINDILDLSKIEAGHIEFEKVTFHLEEIANQVLKTFSFKAQEKSLKLSLDIEQNTPEWIIGDPYRLNQVLMNLVGNAIKFTQQGEISISFSSTQKTQQMVQLKICVSDTGIGIAEENHEMIFESFTQENRIITRKFGGTGLGLSITKRLIELQGGSIHLDSLVGRGSTFTIEMPYLEGEPEGDFTKNRSAIKDLSGLQILVVEDNLTNQLVAKRLLERWGAGVVTAMNGVEALKVVHLHEFDCILMDLQMPVMDGYETTKIIRANEQINRVPIIALTADAFPEIKKLALEAGMDEFVTKPFNQDELFIKISKLVYQLN